MPLFWLQAGVSACVDASLSLACGILLVRTWMLFSASVHSDWPAAQAQATSATFLVLASAGQLLVLSATFTGQRSVPAILSALPDVAATTAGKSICYSCAAALVFLMAAVLQTFVGLHILWCGIALFLYVAVRSTSGHSSVDGTFSLAEVLQCIHLTSMALWSGAVIVSGLLTRRRANLTRSMARRAYMARLSTVSTWSVLLVVLSGIVKAYRQIGGHPRLLHGSRWAYVLGAKLTFVTLALLLGALNRWWLIRSPVWDEITNARSARALQMEAWTMVAVLLLSSALGSTQPLGE